MTDATVTISATRLAELEAAEAKVNARKEKSLARLAAYKEQHPESNLACVKRHIEKNRDAYNARRRELNRLKREGMVKGTALNPPENPRHE